MSRAQIVEADWTWTGEAFEPGIRLRVGADGRLAEVGRLEDDPTLRLRGRALLPGFVDAHSHAFQRGLRGKGERFPAGAGSFWTWREAMYGLVEVLEPEGFYRLCVQAFREMRAAGITAVGEFHYLHHTLHHAEAEARDWALDELVLRAATVTGLRLALLEAHYTTGGISRPLEGAQRRFDSGSPAAYWEQMDRLAKKLDPRKQSLGAVVHSVRAASLDDLAAIGAEARRRGLPLHLHVEEQRQEIEEALAAHGRRPMELVLEALGGAAGVTAVHCTHTDPADMARFAAAGGTVCLCPLTEANLGDGIADLPGMLEAGAGLCLGTDANARISMLEEMRWLEYGQRLARENRGVLRDAGGSVAATLLRAATEGGARALGLQAGRLAPGLWADLVAIDLETPTLVGWQPETLLESVVFGAGNESIAATCVGGDWQEHRGVSG